jgi:hypothetical protein
MNKFDNLLKKYLNEDTVTFNTDAIGDALSKMNLPPKEKQGLADTMGAIADAENPDKLHAKVSDILDPETDTDFSSLSDSEKLEVLNRLKTKDVPVKDAQDTNQQKQNQNTAQQQQKKTPSVQTSTTYSAPQIQGAATYGV